LLVLLASLSVGYSTRYSVLHEHLASALTPHFGEKEISV